MALLREVSGAAPPKVVSNLIINKLLPWAAEQGCPVDSNPVPLGQWAALLSLIESGQVGAAMAYQRLCPAMLEQPTRPAAELATALNLLQSADSDFLEQLVDAVLARFPDKVAEYRKGKKGLLGMFMGEVMRDSKGKAEPQATTRLLQEKLKG
jgi:aspartyl-tRNA(Asn)/glutamyl-tRNA(Gln) amidotransferase subunit B